MIGPSNASAIVYVLGSAPELDVIAAALRLGQHHVIELLHGELTTMTARPCVLLADRTGESVGQLLRDVANTSNADRVEIVMVSDADAPDLDTVGLPFAVYAYRRPLDVAQLIAKIGEILTAQSEENVPPSLPPDPEQGRPAFAEVVDDTPAPLSSPTPMGRIPTPSPLLSYAPSPWTAGEAVPPSSEPPSRWSSSSPPAGGPIAARRSFAGPTSVSPDLEGLLASAEHRVFSEQLSSSDIPSPEEEVNAVLPPDVLAALDEPIDADIPDDDDEPSVARTPAGAGTTGSRRQTGAGTGSSVAFDAPVEPVTATGQEDDAPGPHTSGDRESASVVREEAEPSPASVPPLAFDDVEAEAPAAQRPLVAPAPPSIPQELADVPPGPAAHMMRPSAEPKSSWSSRPRAVPAEAHAPIAQARPSLPPVITPAFDGLRWMAACAAARTSGSVCFESDGVQRRAVMRDGDFVTCASTSADESLIAYLLERGELPRDVTAYMASRVPPYGRHAAAALIATGFLGQDQLWGVLRGHAEWMLARMVRAVGGVGAIEQEPPGRLKAEPSVFGGATGAEVLVEVCRRALSEEEAIARLGGPGAMLAPGRNASLLAECALDDLEHAQAAQIAGVSVQQAIEGVGQPEFAAVLCVLAALGVIEVMAGIRLPESGAAARAAEADKLDAEALRQRVRARLAVIEEGDWFQVLGVPRSSTSYEIRRAFVEARRAFEPSRILTAATADLADDLQLIVQVLEEAYDVLRDEARRARYLRALEAHPPLTG